MVFEGINPSSKSSMIFKPIFGYLQRCKRWGNEWSWSFLHWWFRRFSFFRFCRGPSKLSFWGPLRSSLKAWKGKNERIVWEKIRNCRGEWTRKDGSFTIKGKCSTMHLYFIKEWFDNLGKKHNWCEWSLTDWVNW